MPRTIAAIALPLLLFFISNVQAQTYELDSLHKELKLERSDSSRSLVYGALGYYYAQRNYDSTKYFLNQAIAIARSNEYDLLCVRFLCYSAMASSINGKLDSAVVTMTEAAEIAQRNSLDSALAQTHFGLGNVLHAQGDITSSLDYYLKALKYFESKNQIEGAVRTKGSLSVLYLTLGDYNKAAVLIKETNKFYKENGYVKGQMNGYQRLSTIYKHRGQNDSALFVLSKAKEIAHSLDDTYSSMIIEYSIAGISFEMQNYKKAAVHYEKALTFRNPLGQETEELINIYSKLALSYAYMGEYNASRSTLANAESQINNLESTEITLFHFQTKYKIDSIRGDFKHAFLNLQQVALLKEQLFDEKKSKQFTELETKYGTEKKEAEIASLSQQATIQTLELKQKNLAIAVGGVLVLLIGGLVFFVTRQKSLKSSQNQMELEQRFLRSQLNPHFISNALLAVQNFMLKNQSDMAVAYLSKFSKLMRETLENSRKEFIPLEDELVMLTNFMDVHKMRLNDTFEYEVHVSGDIDPEVDTIPPMFVQPFVENAIEHGISQAEGLGRIDLYFEKEEEYISITIKDNGGGYAQSHTQFKDHVSLSTTIIRERMEIFNKTLKRKIQLILEDIKSEDGKTLGAQVELKVPFGYV